MPIDPIPPIVFGQKPTPATPPAQPSAATVADAYANTDAIRYGAGFVNTNPNAGPGFAPFDLTFALIDIHFDVGSKLIRTAYGWRVERVTAGSAPLVGEGRTIERAFAMVGSTADAPHPETGVRVLRDAAGNVLDPE